MVDNIPSTCAASSLLRVPSIVKPAPYPDLNQHMAPRIWKDREPITEPKLMLGACGGCTVRLSEGFGRRKCLELTQGLFVAVHVGQRRNCGAGRGFRPRPHATTFRLAPNEAAINDLAEIDTERIEDIIAAKSADALTLAGKEIVAVTMAEILSFPSP